MDSDLVSDASDEVKANNTGEDAHAQPVEPILNPTAHPLKNIYHTGKRTFWLIARLRNSESGLLVSSVCVGVLAALAVVLFHKTTELFGELFQYVHFNKSDSYLSFVITPLIPATGGLLVGLLNRYVFRNYPENDGLEVVSEAVAHHRGHISTGYLVKSILTAGISISSGGGGGREAPTILTGAATGSAFGRFFRLRKSHVQILCIAGSSAAISAIFNAPLGAIVFALETILVSINLSSFIPVVISSVVATSVARLFLGDAPILQAPPITTLLALDYPLLMLAGVLSGLMAGLFVVSFRSTKALVVKYLAPVPMVFRPAIGGLLAGILLLFSPALLETTYAPINQAIAGATSLTLFVAVGVILLKPFSAAFTLGSGGAGGVLAVALKVGALFGLVFGLLGQFLFPQLHTGIYAIVCAAAVMAASFRTPLAAAIILFEISHNYEILLPLLFASALAVFITRLLKIQSFNPAAGSLS